jgi:hypothetical protein
MSLSEKVLERVQSLIYSSSVVRRVCVMVSATHCIQVRKKGVLGKSTGGRMEEKSCLVKLDVV